MFRFLQTIANLLGLLLVVAILFFFGLGFWRIYQHLWSATQLQGMVQDLQKELEKERQAKEALQKQVEKLQLANKLLKVDRRIAVLDVVEQTGSAESNDLKTTVVFREFDSDDRPIYERKFTFKGDILYVDAWLAKFQDEWVELGDSVRGATIYLFKRLYGFHQSPEEGLALDREGETPDIYRADGISFELQQQIWSRFWEYANNPKLAESVGLRAVHGQAVSMKVQRGKRYRIQLRASDGLTILPEGEILTARDPAG
jgi:hypothetical protein